MKGTPDERDDAGSGGNEADLTEAEELAEVGGLGVAS